MESDDSKYCHIDGKGNVSSSHSLNCQIMRMETESD